MHTPGTHRRKLFSRACFGVCIAPTGCTAEVCGAARAATFLMRVCVESPCHAYSPTEFRSTGFCWVLRSPSWLALGFAVFCARHRGSLCVLRSPSWLALVGPRVVRGSPDPALPSDRRPPASLASPSGSWAAHGILIATRNAFVAKYSLATSLIQPTIARLSFACRADEFATFRQTPGFWQSIHNRDVKEPGRRVPASFRQRTASLPQLYHSVHYCQQDHNILWPTRAAGPSYAETEPSAGEEQRAEAVAHFGSVVSGGGRCPSPQIVDPHNDAKCKANQRDENQQRPQAVLHAPDSTASPSDLYSSVLQINGQPEQGIAGGSDLLAQPVVWREGAAHDALIG